VGILIFTALSVFLSSRIIKLKNFADAIGRGDLNERLDIKAGDEIGDLAASFNKMSRDLKEKIETIKKLSYVEERERLALEFHDGLAQNLADIIKRLELCERLLKIDPGRAFEELKILRGNTKDILDKTRQVIFDLKTSEDDEFDLSDKLASYVKDYERVNGIRVKLNISGPLNNIPYLKAKSIFYIISEAFTNIKKHSQAGEAELSLISNGSNNLRIDIKDYGKGFDVNEVGIANAGKWGLMNMRQRAVSLGGILAIHSRPNKGTEISANIPSGGG
jgi:signal transduction histidine kinase